jgi:hypothetical protein
MIDGEEVMSISLEENVTAFAVGVVDEQVKEGDGFEKQFFFGREGEVMMVGIVFDELLERARAVGAVLAQDGERDNVKAKLLADDIRGDLAQGKCAFFEIPERLFAARGFVNGGNGRVFVCDFNKEGVIRAERKLTFDLKVAFLEDFSQLLGSVVICHAMILLHPR